MGRGVECRQGRFDGAEGGNQGDGVSLGGRHVQTQIGEIGELMCGCVCSWRNEVVIIHYAIGESLEMAKNDSIHRYSSDRITPDSDLLDSVEMTHNEISSRIRFSITLTLQRNAGIMNLLR